MDSIGLSAASCRRAGRQMRKAPSHRKNEVGPYRWDATLLISIVEVVEFRFAHAEEADEVDDGDDTRNERPAEEEHHDAGSRLSKVEIVSPNESQEESQQGGYAFRPCPYYLRLVGLLGLWRGLRLLYDDHLRLLGQRLVAGAAGELPGRLR